MNYSNTKWNPNNHSESSKRITTQWIHCVVVNSLQNCRIPSLLLVDEDGCDDTSAKTKQETFLHRTPSAVGTSTSKYNHELDVYGWKWWGLVGPAAYKYVKTTSDVEEKQQNQVFFFFLVCIFSFTHSSDHFPQVSRNKSEGGVQKRVYFWGGIRWWTKTPGIAWTTANMKVCYKHTKSLCVGTLFKDEDDDGRPCFFRIVQTRAASDDGNGYRNVSYVPRTAF